MSASLLRGLSGIAAAVINLIIWVVAVPLLDVKLDFTDIQGTQQTVVPLAIVLFSIVPALLGWAFLALLERFTPRLAAPIWTTLAVLVLLLSFAPLFQLSAAAAATLGLMHVVAGVVIIGVMRRTRRPALIAQTT